MVALASLFSKQNLLCSFTSVGESADFSDFSAFSTVFLFLINYCHVDTENKKDTRSD